MRGLQAIVANGSGGSEAGMNDRSPALQAVAAAAGAFGKSWLSSARHTGPETASCYPCDHQAKGQDGFFHRFSIAISLPL